MQVCNNCITFIGIYTPICNNRPESFIPAAMLSSLREILANINESFASAPILFQENSSSELITSTERSDVEIIEEKKEEKREEKKDKTKEDKGEIEGEKDENIHSKDKAKKIQKRMSAQHTKPTRRGGSQIHASNIYKLPPRKKTYPPDKVKRDHSTSASPRATFLYPSPRKRAESTSSSPKSLHTNSYSSNNNSNNNSNNSSSSKKTLTLEEKKAKRLTSKSLARLLLYSSHKQN